MHCHITWGASAHISPFTTWNPDSCSPYKAPAVGVDLKLQQVLRTHCGNTCLQYSRQVNSIASRNESIWEISNLLFDSWRMCPVIAQGFGGRLDKVFAHYQSRNEIHNLFSLPHKKRRAGGWEGWQAIGWCLWSIFTESQSLSYIAANSSFNWKCAWKVPNDRSCWCSAASRSQIQLILSMFRIAVRHVIIFWNLQIFSSWHLILCNLPADAVWSQLFKCDCSAGHFWDMCRATSDLWRTHSIFSAELVEYFVQIRKCWTLK